MPYERRPGCWVLEGKTNWSHSSEWIPIAYGRRIKDLPKVMWDFAHKSGLSFRIRQI